MRELLKDLETVSPTGGGGREQAAPGSAAGRRYLVLAAFVLAAVGLIGRGALLQTEQKAFLQLQGDARHVRVVTTPAHRGLIKDRHGQALAISTPIESVWAIPRELAGERGRWPELAKLLGIELEHLHRQLAERIDREFLYLRRHVSPDVAAALRALEIGGVYLQREYRRYYPAGEVAAHVVGFTDIDDRGQEGLELAYEDWLRGVSGSKQVIQDRLGRSVEDVANVAKARPGRDLEVSIDLRIQSHAYRTLKQAVQRNRAKGGSAVVLDARTGEVLAMVNQPSYNPNKRTSRTGSAARNRALTDVFEPGSTVKPFTIAAALEVRIVHPDTIIDTSPGTLKVGRHLIRDPRDLGRIDVATVLKRSSNVGASKIALATPPEALWHMFSRLGFGEVTATGFPGESAGILTRGARWGELERATLAFGYGFSVTPLQLAQSYAIIANDGRFLPVTLRRISASEPVEPRRQPQVMSAAIAGQLRRMLESVVAADGTGRRARVPGYRIAGKTGTARKSTRGGYSADRYNAVFAGIAPASRPRLVMVVVIDEPQGEEYYGGQIAAPVFAEVTATALRLLRVSPDERDAIAGHIDLTSATSAPQLRPNSSSSSAVAGPRPVSAHERRAG